MSNLATMIMEGSNFGFGKARLAHSYDHESGAGLIAMESAEALRDIFEAEFYIPNTCTIKATLEGASCVEESSQAAIMEASVKGVFQKIKDFFIKLKDKVKDFLHNIIRYLKSFFMSDAKWVEKYKDELKALKAQDLKDYEVKLYNYTIEAAISKDVLANAADDTMNNAKKYIDTIIDSNAGRDKSQDEIDSDDLDEEFNRTYLKFVKNQLNKSVDEDEIDKALWSKYRDGADNENDKEDVKVASNISKFIEVIKNSSKMLDAYNTAINKTDKMYSNAIKFVNDTEQKMGKLEYNEYDVDGTKREEAHLKYINPKSDESKKITTTGKLATRTQVSNITSILRKYSSNLSKMQTFKNKEYTAAKAAITERSSAYKKALVGAFGYARKHKSK